MEVHSTSSCVKANVIIDYSFFTTIGPCLATRVVHVTRQFLAHRGGQVVTTEKKLQVNENGTDDKRTGVRNKTKWKRLTSTSAPSSCMKAYLS